MRSLKKHWTKAACALPVFAMLTFATPVLADRTVSANEPIVWFDDIRGTSKDLVFPTEGDGKNNNGHGNNLDGVDVSNKGQGNGGPNGMEDASGSVDDEAK